MTVVGTDAGGLKASAEFRLTVGEFNDPPVASSLVGQTVVEDTTASYRFKAFTDEETSALTYTFSVVRVVSGVKTVVSPPYEWIDFDEATRTFTFTPSASLDVGEYEVTVVGADAGIGGDDDTRKSISAEFELEVKAVNDPPVAPEEFAQEVSKEVEEGGDVTYQVPVFTDEEDDAAKQSIEYEANLVVVGRNDVESLLDIPYDDWITFDKDTRTFRFTPSESRHKGVYTVRVFARDTSDVETFAEFMLTVGEFNDVPVASPLVDQKVAEDSSESYRFKAFTDEETSSSGLVYSAHLLVFPSPSAGEVLFEGSPASEERSSSSEGSVRPRRVSSAHTEASLPDWISFDGEQRLFRFSPETGAHVGKHVLRVRGRDASGKTETADFVLHVSATNDAPEADVSIEGSLEEGRVVHLRVAGLSDEDGVPSSSRLHRYRWYESSEPEVQSSWSLISGAESASFRVGSGQAGKYLRGVFSYMDSGGTRERVFAQSEEVVRRKSLPSVVVPIFGGEKESSSSSVSVSEEGEALEMVSRSLSQAQERLSLMRNRRSSGSGTPSLLPPRFSLPPVLPEPRVQPPSSQGSGAQAPQSPQAQDTTTQQSGGTPSQPSSQPPGSQGSGAQIPQSPQAQGTSAQQSDGASSQPTAQAAGQKKRLTSGFGPVRGEVAEGDFLLRR